jgi:hypothetical protein
MQEHSQTLCCFFARASEQSSIGPAMFTYLCATFWHACISFFPASPPCYTASEHREECRERRNAESRAAYSRHHISALLPVLMTLHVPPSALSSLLSPLCSHPCVLSYLLSAICSLLFLGCALLFALS